MDREDWETFDDLFVLEGYGGYYDFVECLRMYARAWAEDIFPDEEERKQFIKRVDEAKTLHSVERTLMGLYYRHKKKTKGRYFLDEIDGEIYSTNDYTFWNFYRAMFYGKPFPGCDE